MALKCVKAWSSLMFVLPILIFALFSAVKAVNFENGCEVHLSKARKSTSLTVAENEIEEALRYLESKGLMQGHTKMSGGDDIGAWYSHLRRILARIREVSPKASRTEREVTLLMVDRLMPESPPSGISIYPLCKIVVAIVILGLISAVFGMATVLCI